MAALATDTHCTDAAMISSATLTGDNEFELDGVPLRQMGRGGVWCGKGIVECGQIGR